MLVGVSSLSAQDFSPAARRSDFHTFISDFQDNYAYQDSAEKPWKTWESRYRSAVESAATPEAYAAVFEAALDELHDFHAEVRSPNPHRWLAVPTFADIWAELRDGKAVIVAVRRGSDAERAGIVSGDLVIEVGGEAVEKAVANRLTTAVDNRDPKARDWALLSILTGRADELRHLTVLDEQGHSRRVTLPLERRFDRGSGPLAARILPDNWLHSLR